MNSEARANNFDPSLLESYKDGSAFAQHSFFQKYPDAFRIVLYYDEFEIANPLGENAGVHKIGALYFIVLNLPDHVNSQLSCVHVMALFNDLDRVKYGFKRILHPFLRDLKALESDEGVSFESGGKKFVLRASIAAVVGDTLAVHQILGLLGPSANRFCRLCMISRNDLLAGNFKKGEMRTKEMHDRQVAAVKANHAQSTESGVSDECALHSSKYFHLTSNVVFDVMHDLLEGVIKFELKLVLSHFIAEGYFTVDFFNGRVYNFTYGPLESKNKPRANFTLASLRNPSDHKLKQTAAQTWTLLRVFPFLVLDKVPNGSLHLKLVSLLLQICQIVFAPKLRRDILPYLDALVVEHHELFLTLFGEENLINKHHHMVHYSDSIRAFGPLSRMWCMRFESKHQPMKRRAQNMCNFRNPTLTVICVSQSLLCSTWGRGDFKVDTFKCSNGKTVRVDCTQSQVHAQNLGYVDSDEVFVAESVVVNGTTYGLGMFVCVEAPPERSDNLPLFGKIVEIFVNELSKVYLLVVTRPTLYFDPTLVAYGVNKKWEYGDNRFVSLSDLRDHKPVSRWCTLGNDGRTCISARHIYI